MARKRIHSFSAQQRMVFCMICQSTRLQLKRVIKQLLNQWAWSIPPKTRALWVIKRRRLRSQGQEQDEITLRVGDSVEVKDFETLSHLSNASLSIENFPQLTLVAPSMLSESNDVSEDERTQQQRLLQLTCRIEAIDEAMPTPSFWRLNHSKFRSMYSRFWQVSLPPADLCQQSVISHDCFLCWHLFSREYYISSSKSIENRLVKALY